MSNKNLYEKANFHKPTLLFAFLFAELFILQTELQTEYETNHQINPLQRYKKVPTARNNGNKNNSTMKKECRNFPTSAFVLTNNL